MRNRSSTLSRSILLLLLTLYPQQVRSSIGRAFSSRAIAGVRRIKLITVRGGAKTFEIMSPETPAKAEATNHNKTTYTAASSIELSPKITAKVLTRDVESAEIEKQIPIPTTKRPTSLLEQKLELALCAICVCCVTVMTIPVVILPLIASEAAKDEAASFTATVASLSSVGGGVGQLLNGFVCQHFGGRLTSCVYMLVAGLCSLLLAAPPSSSGISATYIGVVLAGVEFCTSVQWTACSVVVAKHYAATDPASYAQAITYMGLSMPIGTLLAKVLAPALLEILTWRQLSLLGTLVATAGALIMLFFVTDLPVGATPQRREKFSASTVIESIRAVMGSSIFWVAAIPYAISFLPRTGEKVLGRFFQEITNLPASICGALTASITVGFIFGLISSKSFHTLPSLSQKTNMLRRRYIGGVASALLLAMSASQTMIHFLKNPYLIGAVSVLASGVMAFSFAFQFYQMPNIIANCFHHNAICLSFLDGVGFLTVAPIWAFLGKIVTRFGAQGWSVAWTIVAGIYAIAGIMMMSVIRTILERQPSSTPKDKGR